VDLWAEEGRVAQQRLGGARHDVNVLQPRCRQHPQRIVGHFLYRLISRHRADAQ
jgi:hypothetical protein